MKKLFIIPVLIAAALFLQACNSKDNFYFADFTPPVPPSNISVFNGDNVVDIYWNHNRENDLAGYKVYYAYSYNGKYTLLGSTTNNYFIDYGANNGVTYYYAVTAYDFNGNESELSYDVIYSTPRPEGFNNIVYDYRRFPNNSGYNFSGFRVVPFDNQNSDFFFENYNGTFYLNVWDDTDIQDMGRTNDIYDIEFAPNNGWSPTKDEIAKVGHTYVIWTWNNHFAKIRIKNITNERVVFDWAYQLVPGERQLKANLKSYTEREMNKTRNRERNSE